MFGVCHLVCDRLASAVVPSRGGRSSVAAGRPLAAARENKVDWAAGVEEDKTSKSQLEPLTWRRLGAEICPTPPPRSGLPTPAGGWPCVALDPRPGWYRIAERKGFSASTILKSYKIRPTPT